MRKRTHIAALFSGALLTASLLTSAAQAIRPDELLADPAQEARARAISKELRCVVCQNESIDDSNADIAHDLRVLVRQRIVAGDSDQQVRDYMVARYGNYVLLKPPVDPETYLLWFGPGLLLLGGAIGAFLFIRRSRQSLAAAPLTETEAERLAALLDERKDN